MNKTYYSLEQSETEASINIYGDITSWPWMESDVSAYNLSKQIDELDAETINLYINSYGGEVAEGLAIYNALKRHKAKIKTEVDGFACSIASVIFMAGDERVMNEASLLMVHNPWTHARGNAEDFRKQAEDLDTIAQASINAYMSGVSIDEEEVKELLDGETWIDPDTALEKGFATSISKKVDSGKPAQSAMQAIMHRLTNAQESLIDNEAIEKTLTKAVEEAVSKITAAPIEVEPQQVAQIEQKKTNFEKLQEKFIRKD